MDKIHALVLSRRDVGEADRIVTLLAREKGIIKVVAKGVRMVPSRRGGHLEPLTHVLCVVNGSRGHYYLSGVETLDYYASLHHDPIALARIQGVLRVMRSVIEEGREEESIFDAVHQACGLMPKLSSGKQDMLEAALLLYLLKEAGLMPTLETCQRCGRSPVDTVVLQPQEGGWLCLSCCHSLAEATWSITPRLLKVVRWLSVYPERALKVMITEAESEQLVRVVRGYVQAVAENMVPEKRMSVYR